MKGKYICRNYTEDNSAEQQRDKTYFCNNFVFKSVVIKVMIYYFYINEFPLKPSLRGLVL